MHSLGQPLLVYEVVFNDKVEYCLKNIHNPLTIMPSPGAHAKRLCDSNALVGRFIARHKINTDVYVYTCTYVYDTNVVYLYTHLCHKGGIA